MHAVPCFVLRAERPAHHHTCNYTPRMILPNPRPAPPSLSSRRSCPSPSPPHPSPSRASPSAYTLTPRSPCRPYLQLDPRRTSLNHAQILLSRFRARVIVSDRREEQRIILRWLKSMSMSIRAPVPDARPPSGEQR
ncbi:hypothetical protein OH77DRAFT_568877 [Trametes cingulata]|nr:hypothetical protein OH77DRAFT_568877 [Trametes cingulata]